MRFMTTPDTFCVIALERPSDGTLVVPRLLPIRDGDRIELLGAPVRDAKDVVTWRVEGAKTYITAPVSRWDAVQHAWAFQIAYHRISKDLD